MAADDGSFSDSAAARRLDAVAAGRALRRMASAGDAPWLHGEVARRLAERLVPMRAEPRRIVDWWAATGAGADALRAAYPRAERVAVEAASALAVLPAATGARAWWPFGRAPMAARLGDAAADAEIGRAQLVWANMVLHLVRDPPALFARWHGLLEEGGVAVFSCLGPGTLRELRALYVEHGWPAPTPAFIDMHDLGDMMVQAGFAEPVLDQETLTLHWPDAEALLAELHQLGGNTAPDRFAGLRTRAWHRSLRAALSGLAEADGRIAMSIEVAYGHGFRAAPRPKAGEPVAVPLEKMREMVRRPRR